MCRAIVVGAGLGDTSMSDVRWTIKPAPTVGEWLSGGGKEILMCRAIVVGAGLGDTSMSGVRWTIKPAPTYHY